MSTKAKCFRLTLSVRCAHIRHLISNRFTRTSNPVVIDDKIVQARPDAIYKQPCLSQDKPIYPETLNNYRPHIDLVSDYDAGSFLVPCRKKLLTNAGFSSIGFAAYYESTYLGGHDFVDMKSHGQYPHIVKSMNLWI